MGSKNSNSRYIAFNFFMKYIYTLTYNSTFYRKGIVEHIKNKKKQYENLIGEMEYKLLCRYANSKFDTTYFVSKYS
jgi:hypothetical protein